MIQVRLSPEIRAKLRRIAREESTSIRALTGTAVKEYLEARQEKKLANEERTANLRKERERSRREHPGILGGRIRQQLQDDAERRREEAAAPEPVTQSPVIQVNSGEGGAAKTVVAALAAYVAQERPGWERDRRTRTATEILKLATPPSELEASAKALDDAVAAKDAERSEPARAGGSLERLRKIFASKGGSTP